MQLTNEQVENAVVALEAFNPAVEAKTKYRLSRNLRKLTKVRQDKEFDRVRFCYAAMKDKTKQPTNPQQPVILTPEEQLTFQADYRKLLATEVEVELQPVYLYDGTAGQAVPEGECAIDISKVPIPNGVLQHLIDVVLIEPK